MTFLALSVLAGLLTVLAPCILPLLPIVIGAAGTGGARGGKRAITIIASLSVSVIVFTLLLKASTLLIDIPPRFWPIFSGSVLTLLGIFTIFPHLYSKIPLVGKLQAHSNKAVGAGHMRGTFWGDVIVGVALGPVFSTCSPTYLFILATVLPASFVTGLVYLLGFTIGMALSLGAIALLGNALVSRFTVSPTRIERIQKIFGALFVVVGLAILTGFDKKIETYLLDAGIGGTVLFEERLIDRAREQTRESADVELLKESRVSVPPALASRFPTTSWAGADPSIEKALSGGPGKDGIPALDDPAFISIAEARQPDGVQAIVLPHKDTVKVYPYNILIWHEIVNDTADGKPVAVTFCPLCGSAVVFDRTLSRGVTTFGVSGALIESNMVMYDRATESLWQQSTGEALAGAYVGTRLALVSFQLLTMGEVRAQYPKALVVSENTGHVRDYARNPYSGYEESDGFFFEPSTIDARFPAKEIMVVFRIDETPVATPWLAIKEGQTYTTFVDTRTITLQKQDGELTVLDENNSSIPFYFEMWFSFAVQHGDTGIVANLQESAVLVY